MYTLKPETIDKLRERALSHWRPGTRSGDVLGVPLYIYYSKPRYSTRTHPRHYGGTWQTGDEARGDDRAYYCDNLPSGLRDIGDSHEIIRLNHTGWFADHFYDSVIRGRVLQLPSRNGEPVYIPATYCTGWDGVTLYPLDQYDDKDDCARAADSYAENESDRSREFYAKDAAEQDILSCKEDMKDNIERFHIIAKAARPANLGAVLCPLVLEKLSALRESNHANARRIQELKDNYWLAVEQ